MDRAFIDSAQIGRFRVDGDAMPLIFVTSPYAGDVQRNVRYAQAAAKFVLDAGYAPVVPHLYLPGILDDNVERDRRKGMSVGTRLMHDCSAVWVFNDYGVSKGMEAEIEYANKLVKSVEFKHIPNWSDFIRDTLSPQAGVEYPSDVVTEPGYRGDFRRDPRR